MIFHILMQILNFQMKLIGQKDFLHTYVAEQPGNRLYLFQCLYLYDFGSYTENYGADAAGIFTATLAETTGYYSRAMAAMQPGAECGRLGHEPVQ